MEEQQDTNAPAGGLSEFNSGLSFPHDEMKPCPFCKGVARVIQTKDMSGYFYAECVSCFTRQLAYSKERDDAISRWNARPIEDHYKEGLMIVANIIDDDGKFAADYQVGEYYLGIHDCDA